MKRFICHNQISHIPLLFFYYYICFQVNCSSSLSSSSPNTSTHHLCPPKQSLALLQFKSEIPVDSEPMRLCLHNSSRKLDSWKEGSDCCSWDGVTCNEITGNVIGLDLDCSRLRGTIDDSSSLFQLSHLQWLNLACNNFYGSKISPEFGRFTELTQLNLSSCNFDGMVPSEISLLSKLTLLDLSCKNYFGYLIIDQKNFDLFVLNLTRLSVLKLSYMDMSSIKPYSLLNLSWSMMILDLSSSGMQGKFPEEIFHLPILQEIYLFSNRDLTGYLPKFNRSNHLRVLDLSSCNFKGEIPDSIGNLNFLEILSINEVGFTGLIPTSINNLTRLTELEMAENNLIGELPSLSKLQKVIIIRLRENMLTGKVSSWLFTLPSLMYIDLSSNNLTALNEQFNFSSSLQEVHFPLEVILQDNEIHGTVPTWFFTLPSLEYIDLSRNKLTGFIEQFNFSSSLQEVHLQYNEIHGTVPTGFFTLPSLKYIDLSRNKLTGFIEQLNFSSSLQEVHFPLDVNLQDNEIHGTVPTWFFTLPSLEYIDLSRNKFTGPIEKLNFSNSLREVHLQDNEIHGKVPSCLLIVPSLEYVDLSSNKLIGPMEEFNLGSVNSLQELHLQDNEIHGSIPNSIFELVNLAVLDISSNNLSGTVKLDMLSKLKNLKTLNLSNNSRLAFGSTNNMNHSLPNLLLLNFSFCNVSEFPMFLRTSEKLQSLLLSNNRIYGRIFKTGSKGWKSLTLLDLSNNFLTYIEHHPWKNIQVLLLQNNAIQGSILVPPLSTSDFFISNNKLSGQIPPSICRLRSIQTFSMSENNLSGTIPPCLGNFGSSLVMLHLQKNNLQGGIPNTFVEGSWLRSLDLNSNKLEGPLPRSLANCSHLEVVNVGNNMISDTFPCWLGTLSELKILILRSNRFSGPICVSETFSPFGNLQIIDLSHNELNGFLPRRFFEAMERMMDANSVISIDPYIGGTYYYDSVAVTMKGGEYKIDRILTIFTSVDLSINQFQGEIPESLGKFKSLVVLNFSHNNLTGNIPMSLSNMTALESLDLSFNKLDGKIPGQLVNVTTLGTLNLSYNRLSGLIPQGNQFNTFENNSFIGNKGLCGKPLSVKCGNDGATTQPPSTSVSNEEDETTSGFDWKFAMTGYASGVVIGISMGYIVFSTRKPQWFVRMIEERLIKKVRRTKQRRGRTNK